MELENGRRLAYYDSAPNASSDRPVILVAHGMIYDPELPEPIHDLLTQRLNYRIIGISRAYYGDSSPPSEDINAFEQSLADTVAVLSAIGIKSVSVIAHKSGGEHALYWANQRPDLIQRIFVVSGIAPIQSSEDFADMPAGVRTVARTARYFPSLLPLLLRASLVMIHHGDFARLAHIGYQDSVSDMSYIDDAAVAKRLASKV